MFFGEIFFLGDGEETPGEKKTQTQNVDIGKLVAVNGPHGSGKATLLRLLGHVSCRRCRTSCSTVGGWIPEEFREFLPKGAKYKNTPFKHVPCHLGIFFPIDASDSDREGLKLFYCISRGLLSGFLIDICQDILSCETYVYIYIYI